VFAHRSAARRVATVPGPACFDSHVARAEEADVDRALEIFLAERTRLLGIARRVVGDACSAEDVVQETWLRWQRADRAEIRNATAFLGTVTMRLAINVLGSARHRREQPSEQTLADVADRREDFTGEVERIADVGYALDLLVAKLMPAELAAYLLRKGFDYPYPDIARMLRTSTPNARQLVRRAQLRVEVESETNRAITGDTNRRLLAAFLWSARSGELGLLEAVLAEALSARSRRGPSEPQSDLGPGRRHAAVLVPDCPGGREAVVDSSDRVRAGRHNVGGGASDRSVGGVACVVDMQRHLARRARSPELPCAAVGHPGSA
jgi:RNA polymerase sigma factor (sigma-70 family)